MILYPQRPASAEKTDETVVAKFRARFGANNVRALSDGWADVDTTLEEHGVTHLILVKYGYHDGRVSLLPSVRTCVLANFEAKQPHGHAYAKVSHTIPSPEDNQQLVPVVPHIVRPPPSPPPPPPQPLLSTSSDEEKKSPTVDTTISTQQSLRRELGIPADATVFGRHGGSDTFNVKFVQEAVLDVAAASSSSSQQAAHSNRGTRPIYFLFLNTDPFSDSGGTNNAEVENGSSNSSDDSSSSSSSSSSSASGVTRRSRRRSSDDSAAFPNILHLPATADGAFKERFIGACDAMLHARSRGETFGLAGHLL
jgi:hypothetical protein